MIVYSNAFDDDVMDVNSSEAESDSPNMDWDTFVASQVPILDWAEEVERVERLEELERLKALEALEAEREAAELAGSTFYNEETEEYEVIIDPEVEDESVTSDDDDDSDDGETETEIVIPEVKMAWVIPEIQSFLDDDEFPSLNTPPPKKSCFSLRRVKRMKPLKIDIRISNVTSIAFSSQQDKAKPICKFIAEGKECPHKACRFTHPAVEEVVTSPKVKPICKFIAEGKECPHKACRFTHPEGTPQPKAPETKKKVTKPHSKKLWFCKNIIQYGTCKYGNECLYAHTVDEVKKNATKCRYGLKCTAVVNKNGVYSNSGPKKCIRLHGAETTDNFIKRMQ